MKNLLRFHFILAICLLVSCRSSPNIGPLMPAIFTSFDLNNSAGVKFNADGIPLVKIWSTDEYSLNPTTVAQWGLGAYARYAKNSSIVEKERFFKAAQWLVSHQDQNGGFPLMFDHIYPNPKGYHLKAPWYSAISQGNAISLLARAYLESGGLKYKRAAERALNLFTVPTRLGGILGSLNDSPWYEETPDPKAANHIFNGFIFALLGLDDLVQATGHRKAKRLWQAGQASLKKNLHLFVIHSAPEDRSLPIPWSVYDLQHLYFKPVPNYLGDFYMGIHIVLMQEMFKRTGHERYDEISRAWTVSLAEYKKTH